MTALEEPGARGPRPVAARAGPGRARRRTSRVAVVALGDLGRSPRMLYHALALAAEEADVDLVGYAGSALPREVEKGARIRVHRLAPPLLERPHRLPRPLRLVHAALRAAGLAVRLLLTLLLATRRPDVILVQTPPAIPTLPVALVAARARGARLVVDWHNFGHAVLALSLGPAHPAVALARALERAAGRRADAHLCVSEAMRAELDRAFRIPSATVLRDRPARRFAPTPPALRPDLLRRLGADLAPRERGPAGPGRHPAPRAVLVTATSFTADEDLGLLLEAASRFEAMVRADDGRTGGPRRLPDALVLVTGRGPRRADFEAELERRAAAGGGGPARVRVRTLWLEPDDYPRLLGSADLGLCLHRSASGFDLPMKVADMFGAGLPVLALGYGPVQDEQVRDGENGRVFRTAGELADQLGELLSGFPDDAPHLERLRRGVARLAGAGLRWEDGWREEARPVLLPPRAP